MRQYGVTQKFVRVCQGLYEEVEASVVLDGEQSRWFKVEKGLRQGCPLSPLLYSIYVMGMVEELEDSGLGEKRKYGVEHCCTQMILFCWQSHLMSCRECWIQWENMLKSGGLHSMQ